MELPKACAAGQDRRRTVAMAPNQWSAGLVAVAVSERELEQSKHAVAVAMAATDAAVIRLTPPEAEDDLNLYATPFQEVAAARIEATFRGYLVSPRECLCVWCMQKMDRSGEEHGKIVEMDMG
ncbi:hypothetical protein ZWY2020_019545 [Hordeum vulgare]|nr:hypothetical protein ZWY2020_019545 [Hordeum vulgare]